jgi:hypothetical protein
MSPSPILFTSRCPISPAGRRSLLPALPGPHRRRPAARSAGGPSRGRSVRCARGASSADDVALDFVERRLRAFGVSTGRRATPPGRSSSSGGPASRSSARFRDGRLPRSPRGAEASAAQPRNRRDDRRSDGEPLAPLGSSTSEHAASALRRHARHEAVLALARALLGLIRPLHGLRAVPRSTFTIRGHQTHERLAYRQPAHEYGGPSRSGSRFYRRAGTRSNVGSGKSCGLVTIRWPACPVCRLPSASHGADGPDPLPRRFGRCYSGPTPGPDRPIRRPISARRRTHQPTRNPRRSVRSTSV